MPTKCRLLGELVSSAGVPIPLARVTFTPKDGAIRPLPPLTIVPEAETGRTDENGQLLALDGGAFEVYPGVYSIRVKQGLHPAYPTMTGTVPEAETALLSDIQNLTPPVPLNEAQLAVLAAQQARDQAREAAGDAAAGAIAQVVEDVVPAVTSAAVTEAVAQVGEALDEKVSAAEEARDITLAATASLATQAVHPQVRIDNSPKAVVQFGANERRIYTLGATDGYLLHSLRNNVTTNGADSLGLTGADQTQWRILSLLRCVEVVLGFKTPSSSFGAWLETTLITGIPAYTSGSYYSYDYSVDVGAWREYTVEVPASGILGISLLTANNGAESVSVAVDGADVLTDINLKMSARRIDFEIRVAPGSRVVRVTNNDAISSRLGIVGLNFATLKDQKPGWVVSHLGHYRNSNRIDPLISPPSSANDYAIFDRVANLWGGSYHGGENNFTELFLVDGASVAPTVGQILIGRAIAITQASTIDWSAYGGATIDVFNRMIWSQGGYSAALSFTGEILARDFFPCLFGANKLLTQVDTPLRLEISSIDDGAYRFFPKGSAVELSAGGLDRVRIDHSHYPGSPDTPFLWRVTGASGYHKYYVPLVRSGERICNEVQSVVVVTA